MDYTLALFLTQLLAQAPMLLTYLVGAILALVFRRRCPRPAQLTFLAMMLLLLTTPVDSFFISYFTHAKIDFGWSNEKYGIIMAVTGLIGTLIHVAAFALLLTAVFIGRRESRSSLPLAK